jgi:Transposase DDE domain
MTVAAVNEQVPDDQLARLRGFREGLYGCALRRADALFELADSLIAGHHQAVGAPPHLSLEPVFRRGHGSTYAALRRGQLDEQKLRRLLVDARPRDWPLVFAVDCSSWPRCDAETSPERGYYHHPSRHSAGKPIVAGWNYSWIAQLNWERNSWAAPLDVARIPPREDTVRTTAAQLTQLVQRLELGPDDPIPLAVFDGGYDPIGLTLDLADTRCQVLVRIRDDRVFYHDPPPRHPGSTGRPRRHGNAFRCTDPASWGTPDATLLADDRQYGRVEVSCWSALHPKLNQHSRFAGSQAPIVPRTIIRVEVEHLPKPTSRAKKTLWLWWAGPAGQSPDLDLCWRAYIRRFDIEHTLRFAKNTLGWTTPRVRLPEQADRWTWLVLAAYTQLRLARGLLADQRLPWERPRDPQQLTPTRIRRGFRALVTHLGTPARPPKPSRAGPGRPKGSLSGPAPRHPAIKKAA